MKIIVYRYICFLSFEVSIVLNLFAVLMDFNDLVVSQKYNVQE